MRKPAHTWTQGNLSRKSNATNIYKHDSPRRAFLFDYSRTFVYFRWWSWVLISYLEKSVTMTVLLRAYILHQCKFKTKSCPVLQTKWGQTSNFRCKIIKSIPTRCDCTMYDKSMMDRKTKRQHWIGLGPRKAHVWKLFINCEVKASEISKASVSVVHFFSKDLWF